MLEQSAMLILFSFFCGGIGAFCIYKFGGYFQLMDQPNVRSSHILPTPKGGGIGICISFLVLSFYADIPIYILIPILLIILIGFLADYYKDISPTLRLTIQFFSASLFVICLSFESSLFYIKNHVYFYSFIVFAIFFLVGTANFYNFMDGINGIASITGTIAFCLLGFSAIQNQSDISIITLLFGLSFAYLGFLPFNFPKANVFMGDVGSIFSGFLFSMFVILLSNHVFDIVYYSGFLFPFYADEMISIYERRKQKQSLLKPHRKHLYQVLANEKKWGHTKVTLLYAIIQCFVGISLLFLKPFGIKVIITFLGIMFFMFSYFNFKIKCK